MALMVAGTHIPDSGATRRIIGAAKAGRRGQSVIPKEARALFGIGAGDALLIPGEGKSA